MVKIKCLLISLCLLTNVDAVDSSVYIHEACINNAPDNIPKERALGLAHLNQMNAWFAHERFWAAGGVIDPHTYEQQRTSRAAFAGTPIAFLNDLSTTHIIKFLFKYSNLFISTIYLLWILKKMYMMYIIMK
jgi:hypothetical protein